MQTSSTLTPETIESQNSLKAKRDQFTSEIRKQKLENELNVKRIKFDKRIKLCEEMPTSTDSPDVQQINFFSLILICGRLCKPSS